MAAKIPKGKLNSEKLKKLGLTSTTIALMTGQKPIDTNLRNSRNAPRQSNAVENTNNLDIKKLYNSRFIADQGDVTDFTKEKSKGINHIGLDISKMRKESYNIKISNPRNKK